MEDIGKAISTLELTRCNDIEDEGQRLIRKVEELYEQTKALMQKVEKLYDRGLFPEGIALDVFEEKRGDFLPTSKLAGETTAIRNMEKIYDFIIGDVRKIGVYGMGGIGKTTVMKHINNRILEEKRGRFDCVIWVTVSKDSSVFKLQDDIACRLNVNLSNYKDTTTRAGALYKAFQQNGRYLLILDDLWEGYPLEDVGIPNPDYANGCKLALTTRSFYVCRSMKCEAIQMDLLSKEEAWSLFLEHVGLDLLNVNGLKPIMKDVASECGRLPLAITTIAVSMRGEIEPCEWRDALKKLRASSSDKGEKVIEQLKFSYDRLKNEKLKKCLLLCALYPEDKEIERRELIELLALDGIIEEKECKSDEVDEGNVLLNNLINQCLLEGGKTYEYIPCVKMHDLVRDMAVQINSLHSKYLTVSGIKLSNVKWSEKLLKIHISNCYSSNVSPMCPKLTIFILQDYFLTNIPDSFFQHFNALKVLNLSRCGSLQVLPNSISDLVNLVGLLLGDCCKLTYVPPLARLKDLQTLDLSVIMFNRDLLERKDFLIEDLENLSNLRYVNLILCSIEVFPIGIIPRLFNLRYLVCNPLTKVSASELMCLKNLEMFKGSFHDTHDLCVYVKHIEQKMSQLSSYVFVVGSTIKSNTIYNEYLYNSCDNVVILENCNLDKLSAENKEYLLPKDVQWIEIASDPDLASLCALAFLNSARNFRYCIIIDCKGVRELVSTSSSSFVLSSLEWLHLQNMKNLEALIGGKKKACNVFPCLRELRLWRCDRMKVVFTIGLLSNLNNLVVLSVRSCKELEEIVGEWLDDEKNVNEGVTQITLPNLKDLHLWGLPHLRSICPASRPLICKSLWFIYILECPELEQCVNVGWDERGEASPSGSLQPIQLKSPMKKRIV